MPGNVTRTAAVALSLGALAYTAWVLEAVLGTGPDPVRGYVSELAAADQPFGGFFRAADRTAGFLVLVGALAGLLATLRRRAAPPPPPGVPSWARRPDRAPGTAWSVAGWAALAVFGAATVADSWLPLSCAPTTDPACAAREAAGAVPATHAAHAVSSGLATTGAVVAMILLTAAARRHGRWGALARTGAAVLALELAATAWTLAAVTAFEAGTGNWALGVAQRLQVLLVALWLAVLARALHRERRP
ncbi:DUF998 domain-containing protein [Streptomyces sp.]|uniref:DUF998 domain-containing protein n=1 Tax=Streptomyces sp. TaxID=1931 RepID=UPI0028122A74|nr:DUF998 domain-containing protein [Streptomyces sp.]